jgi:hypothetical protein
MGIADWFRYGKCWKYCPGVLRGLIWIIMAVIRVVCIVLLFCILPERLVDRYSMWFRFY